MRAEPARARLIATVSRPGPVPIQSRRNGTVSPSFSGRFRSQQMSVLVNRLAPDFTAAGVADYLAKHAASL